MYDEVYYGMVYSVVKTLDALARGKYFYLSDGLTVGVDAMKPDVIRAKTLFLYESLLKIN